jgi:hypothetical protein
MISSSFFEKFISVSLSDSTGLPMYLTAISCFLPTRVQRLHTVNYNQLHISQKNTTFLLKKEVEVWNSSAEIHKYAINRSADPHMVR